MLIIKKLLFASFLCLEPPSQRCYFVIKRQKRHLAWCILYNAFVQHHRSIYKKKCFQNDDDLGNCKLPLFLYEISFLEIEFVAFLPWRIRIRCLWISLGPYRAFCKITQGGKGCFKNRLDLYGLEGNPIWLLKKKTSKARILHRKGYERGSKFSYFDCQCEGEGDKSL